uniref:Uncharacterized protein n=1 Tax=Hyaloperonospora arabidopsidis (strain Emoy2) TaxID=559515 RepID=M4B178_HYAAE
MNVPDTVLCGVRHLKYRCCSLQSDEVCRELHDGRRERPSVPRRAPLGSIRLAIIELRRQQLEKTWQHFLLTEEMEQEELEFERELRRFDFLKKEEEKKRKEEKKKRGKEAREKAEREHEEVLRRKWEKEKVQVEKQKKQVTGRGTQTDESALKSKKSKEKTKAKSKVLISGVTQEKQERHKTKVKRIAPICLPVTRPEDEEVVGEKRSMMSTASVCDSPPPELPDNGLLNLLSMDKGSSDSDADDEPSTMSLILPVAQDSAKPPPAMKKKVPTVQKKVAKKKRDPPLDFNFTNAGAKRQVEVDAAAQDEQDEQDRFDEGEPESEPMPAPPVVPPKKRLKRRKDVAKDRQAVNGTASGGNSMMAAVAKTTIATKPKKGARNSEINAESNVIRKMTIEDGKVVKDPATSLKSKNAQRSAQVEGSSSGLLQKRKATDKTEMMSIKDRLANAELLAQMNKRQDINTPKVLGKNTKKAQKQGAAKSLAAKRAEKREALSSGTAGTDIPRSDQIIDEGDLNISLNSSGLMSDNDSPESVRVPTRKRPREVKPGDVTPRQQLQFLEITKRLAKSPMPRLLRTPTPLMSPVGPSVLMRPKAVSPGPRAASARNIPTRNEGTRRMNSAPVRPKRATDANQFGAPNRFTGGASVAAGVGSFSMFDAFVNSGSNGSIPRLKSKIRGDVSPSM